MSVFQELYCQMLTTKQTVDRTLASLKQHAQFIHRKYEPRHVFDRWKQTTAGKQWKAEQYQRQQQQCANCRCSISLKGSHIDHIKPLKCYPQLAIALDNLQILCADCNTRKGIKE